jgi:uncharacterized membrane protein
MINSQISLFMNECMWFNKFLFIIIITIIVIIIIITTTTIIINGILLRFLFPS